MSDPFVARAQPAPTLVSHAALSPLPPTPTHPHPFPNNRSQSKLEAEETEFNFTNLMRFKLKFKEQTALILFTLAGVVGLFLFASSYEFEEVHALDEKSRGESVEERRGELTRLRVLDEGLRCRYFRS